MKNNMTKNTIWSVLSHIFSRGSLMVSAIILARYLNTEDFVSYSYFQMTITMVATYSALGLGITASRYFSELGHEESVGDAFPIGTLWLISIILSILIFLIVLALPKNYIDSKTSISHWLFALGAMAMSLQIIPTGAILGLEKYKYSVIISFFSGAFMLCIAYIAAINNSILIAIVGLIVGSIIQMVGETTIVIRVIGWKILRATTIINWSNIVRIGTFAGPMLGVSLLAASGTWIVGRLILQHSEGAREFALYSIGLQWFGLALIVPGMLSRVLLPRMVKTKKFDKLSKKKLVLKGALLGCAASVALAIVVGLFNKQLMMIYGDKYVFDSKIIILFLAAAIFSSPANTIGNAILAHDGQKTCLFITIVWFVVLMITSSIAVSRGTIAVAIAINCAEAAKTATTYLFAKIRGLI